MRITASDVYRARMENGGRTENTGETGRGRIEINIKEKDSGTFVYSFAARQDNISSTKKVSALDLDVRQQRQYGEESASLSEMSVQQNGEDVNQYSISETESEFSEAERDRLLDEYRDAQGELNRLRQRYIMAVILKQSSAKQTLYTLHDAVVIDDNISASVDTNRVRPGKQEDNPTGRDTTISVLLDIAKVNRDFRYLDTIKSGNLDTR